MFSIFHTSHCGSTLLSCLLSKSIDVYTEPKWSHKLHEQEDPIEYVKQHTKNNALIKYSSVYCYLMPKIETKKVFLYRKLTSHLLKMKDSKDYIFQSSRMVNNLHKRSLSVVQSKQTALQWNAFLWQDRFFWSFDATNIMYVDCEDLFKNPQYVARQVCHFLGIDYIPVDIDYHVKFANLNHSDTPIDIDKVELKQKYIEPYIEYDFDIINYANEIGSNGRKIKNFV